MTSGITPQPISAMNANTPAATQDTLICDASQRFVRVLGRRDNGLIEFEFAIGWPELFVELMLPEPAFAQFCQQQNAQRLDTTEITGDNTREHRFTDP
jgi:phenol hydroxylase P0 protein